MSFRKEKKYRVSLSEMLVIKDKLALDGMTTLYPERKIKSCYFDNQTLDMFNQSEEGVLPRRKIRVRWYNNSLKFSKEIKISSLEGRYKKTETIDRCNSEDEIFKMSFLDNEYGLLTPKLHVSYDRHYFTYKSLRLTFDRNIVYSLLTSHIKRTISDSECVIEIKTPIDTDDEYIEKFITFPTSRFSKYSRGFLNFEVFN
jgi:hypothetical protein